MDSRGFGFAVGILAVVLAITACGINPQPEPPGASDKETTEREAGTGQAEPPETGGNAFDADSDASDASSQYEASLEDDGDVGGDGADALDALDALDADELQDAPQDGMDADLDAGLDAEPPQDAEIDALDADLDDV